MQAYSIFNYSYVYESNVYLYIYPCIIFKEYCLILEQIFFSYWYIQMQHLRKQYVNYYYNLLITCHTKNNIQFN